MKLRSRVLPTLNTSVLLGLTRRGLVRRESPGTRPYVSRTHLFGFAWIAGYLSPMVLGAMLLFTAAAAVRAQVPVALVAGLKMDRTLAPRESHTYTVTLEEGEAVVGETDEMGASLLVDISDPDGKLLRTVDSSDGAAGKVPIDLTALKSGMYQITVRTGDPAKASRYVLNIERILSVDENGERMAGKNYPPVLQGLWRHSLTDPRAVEKFVASRKGKGPIIEPVPGDVKHVKVTYLYYGDGNTILVRTSGGPHAAAGGIFLRRFMQTPLFFAEEIVPNDARYRYGFAAVENRFVGASGTVQLKDDVFSTDVLNPDLFGGISVLAMPGAPPQLYVDKRESVPQGKLTSIALKSNALGQDRPLTVYTPPGYDGSQACDLVIVLDGETYDGGPTSFVPTPTILDNLIAAGKVTSTIAVLVQNVGNQRARDLGLYKPFADFVAGELIPWARKAYRINSGAEHVVIAGSSRGGHSAAFCAFSHPEAIGNVLSQSGSYWITKGSPIPPPWLVTEEESGELIRDFRDSEKIPVKFYIEIGRFDDSGRMLATNRHFRDILLLKGYDVDYREFDSGHDYIWWRGSLADGLISLLGRRKL